MSELVPIRRGSDMQSTEAIPAALPVPSGPNMLRAWAMSLADASALAEALCRTPFVPDSYRPRVDPRASLEQRAASEEIAVATAAAAIMYGANLGFDPMSALLNVYVINGRPSMYAAAQVALLQAAGHEVWTEDLTEARAVVCGRRRGSEVVERVVVTMDMARKAGWTRNQKYATEPDSMLWARAASRVCRRVAQDTLKGLGASVEELQDGDETPAAAPATRTVRRAPVPRPAIAAAEATVVGQVVQDANPPLPGEDEPTPPKASASSRVKRKPATPPAGSEPPLPGEEEPAEAAEPDPVTDAQLKKLHASFGDFGIEDKAARLAYCCEVIGREITSSLELTKDEASLVIDRLEQPPFADTAPGGDAEQLPVEDPPDGES